VASTAPSASLLYPSSSGSSSAHPIRFFQVTSAPSAAKLACIIYSPLPLVSPHLSFLTYLFKPGTSWELLSKPNPIQCSWIWKCLSSSAKEESAEFDGYSSCSMRKGWLASSTRMRSDLKCKYYGLEGDIYPAILPVLILSNHPSHRREKSAERVAIF
jgi:hypothetical protein